jgi:hypothetical protein
MALLAIDPVSTSLACRLQCNLKMQNTRVSQLGDPLQVGVQGRRVVQDRGPLKVCICLEELLARDPPENTDLLYNQGPMLAGVDQDDNAEVLGAKAGLLAGPTLEDY